MVFNYNGTDVHYEIFGGTEGEPILLLHGWGGNGKVFNGLIDMFPSHRFVVLDFPPFGESDKTIEGWNIFTYASMVMSLCEQLSIDVCQVIGHSFGGRVAILLAALKKQLVSRLVLLDAAGMKPRRSLKYYIKLYGYKLRRKLGFFVVDAGSNDYQALPENMKPIFVSIVSQHLEEYCSMIYAPTLIVFGKSDNETPIYMAKRLHKLIRKSKLVLLEDAGHYCFLDSPLAFYKELKEFWEENV